MKTKRIVLVFSVFIFLTMNIFAQSGGNFTITQSAIASGGGQNSAGGNFSLDGTVGQSAAGNALRNSPFAVTSGFWNFTATAPTAAQVSISGRVRTINGSGIRNVLITLTLPSGETRNVTTSSFGYFRFENVSVGETYIISVSAKKYTFSQPTIIRTVLDQIADLDFVSDAE